MNSVSRLCTVLLSGGVDSAVVAALLKQSMWQLDAVWVNYKQPAAAAEQMASRAIAAHLDIPWHCVKVDGLSVPGSGEIPGRNDLLIAVARSHRPNGPVAIGIHAGTGYSDCSPEWRLAWQTLADLQSGGVAPVLTPLLHLRKRDVLVMARSLQIPLALAHSCEKGSTACGTCRSCLDRSGDDGTAE